MMKMVIVNDVDGIDNEDDDMTMIMIMKIKYVNDE